MFPCLIEEGAPISLGRGARFRLAICFGAGVANENVAHVKALRREATRGARKIAHLDAV